jgi:hypothetical protein
VIIKINSGRGVFGLTRHFCEVEKGVQFISPDPISQNLVVLRCGAGFGITSNKRKSSQDLLTLQRCILGLRRLVSLLRLLVRQSSRLSLVLVGLKSCFAQLINLRALGYCVAVTGFVFAGAVSGEAASTNVGFGRVVVFHTGFGWWYGQLVFNTAITILLFWVLWVVTGNNKHGK